MGLFHQKDHRQELIDRLKEDYINELQLSEQLKHHAGTARYQQFRDKLSSLAESEKKQAAIIKEILEKLGAEAPKEIPPVSIEKDRNLFQALSRDLEMDNQDYSHYYQRLFEAETEGLTEILPTLNQLRKEEDEHRQTLRSILQKLNPYQV